MRFSRTRGVLPMASRILLQRMYRVFPALVEVPLRQKTAAPCHTQFSMRFRTTAAGGAKQEPWGVRRWNGKIFRAERRGSRLWAIRGRCGLGTRCTYPERRQPGRTEKSWELATRTRRQCKRFATSKRHLRKQEQPCPTWCERGFL